jgi:alpha-galactosidase
MAPLFESPTKFPSGMPALAEYLHDRGLKLGVYSDRGPDDFSGSGYLFCFWRSLLCSQCFYIGTSLGMKGHEVEDAAVMASW